MAQPLETLIANRPVNSLHAEFYSTHLKEFNEIRNKPNFLESLVLTAEKLGTAYTKEVVDRVDFSSQGSYTKESLLQTLELKELNQVETKNPILFTKACEIARDAERLKRTMLLSEIDKSGDRLTNSEKIIFTGSLILGELTDQIYFNEWLPLIKTSPIGKELAKMENLEEGSAAKILPGKVEDIRWHTREIIDQNKPLIPDNIKLIPYRESLSSVSVVIEKLDILAELLDQEKQTGEKDFGYADFFKKWSECLKGNGNKKKLEDEMMIAWRQIDADTPIFIVPWAEYAYNDPAGVAIVPSLRIGVTATDEKSIQLKTQVGKLKNSLIHWLKKNNIPGSDSISKSSTQWLAWTSFSGMDTVSTPSSQVLPNDSKLRNKHGYYVMPDLQEQKLGEQRRIMKAEKVYPKEILGELNRLRFSNEETAIYEMEGHENFHSAGVIQKGENNLGKLSNLFEEAKATLGALFVQVTEKKDIEFARKAVASLVFPIPRYLSFDGNPTIQGYANEARVVANLAQQIGIINYDSESKRWSLDLQDNNKIGQFWQKIEEFIYFCFDTYKGAAKLDDLNDIQKFNVQTAEKLNQFIGKIKISGKEEFVDILFISTVKQILEFIIFS